MPYFKSSPMQSCSPWGSGYTYKTHRTLIYLLAFFQSDSICSLKVKLLSILTSKRFSHLLFEIFCQQVQHCYLAFSVIRKNGSLPNSCRHIKNPVKWDLFPNYKTELHTKLSHMTTLNELLILKFSFLLIFRVSNLMWKTL